MRRLLYITLVSLLSSCSMQYSMNGGSTPPGAETFSVAYFDVRTASADPNYGQQVTEGLRDLLLTQTKLRLAEQVGDIQYSGEITRYQVTPVAASGDEISTLNRLSIAIRIEYVNLIEPDKNKDFTLTQFEDFDASSDLSAVEEDLLEAINDKILQDIYDRTLGDW